MSLLNQTPPFFWHLSFKGQLASYESMTALSIASNAISVSSGVPYLLGNVLIKSPREFAYPSQSVFLGFLEYSGPCPLLSKEKWSERDSSCETRQFWIRSFKFGVQTVMTIRISLLLFEKVSLVPLFTTSSLLFTKNSKKWWSLLSLVLLPHRAWCELDLHPNLPGSRLLLVPSDCPKAPRPGREDTRRLLWLSYPPRHSNYLNSNSRSFLVCLGISSAFNPLVTMQILELVPAALNTEPAPFSPLISFCRIQGSWIRAMSMYDAENSRVNCALAALQYCKLIWVKGIFSAALALYMFIPLPIVLVLLWLRFRFAGALFPPGGITFTTCWLPRKNLFYF